MYFRVFVKPLVNLIWLAGLVFLLGSPSHSGPIDASSEARCPCRGGRPSGDPLTIAVVLAAALAVACVILVALPFLRARSRDRQLDELDEGSGGVSSCSSPAIVLSR